jgi:hypothetical protein
VFKVYLEFDSIKVKFLNLNNGDFGMKVYTEKEMVDL